MMEVAFDFAFPPLVGDVMLSLAVHCTLVLLATLIAARALPRRAALRQTVLRIGWIGVMLCPFGAAAFHVFNARVLTLPSSPWLQQLDEARPSNMARAARRDSRIAIATATESTESTESDSSLAAAGAVLPAPVEEEFPATNEAAFASLFASKDTVPLESAWRPQNASTTKSKAESKTESKAVSTTEPALWRQLLAIPWRSLSIQSALIVGLAGWAMGALWRLIGVARACWSVGRLIAQSEVNDDDSIRLAAERSRRSMRLERFPRVVTSPHVSTPVVGGVLHPVILLPRGIDEQLSPDELQMVLTHEAAHIIQHDQAYVLAERIFAAVFWLHPLCHLLLREMSRAREEVCDNYVLSTVDGLRYGETLFRLVHETPELTPLPGGVGLFSLRWKLEQRISGLLDKRREVLVHTRQWQKAALSLLMLVGVGTLCATELAALQGGTETGKSDLTPDKSAVAKNTGDLANEAETAQPGELAQAKPDGAAVLADEAKPDNKQPDKGGESAANPTSFAGDLYEVKPDEKRAAKAGGYYKTDKLFYTRRAPMNFAVAKAKSHDRNEKRHGRIAVVNVARVFNESPLFKQRIEALKNQQKGLETSFRDLVTEINALQAASNALKTDESGLAAKKQLQDMIYKKRAMHQNGMKQARIRMVQEEATTYHDVYKKIYAEIQRYAEENDIELVLRDPGDKESKSFFESADPNSIDSSNRQAILKQINQHVLYIKGMKAEKRVDITDAIIARLAKYGASVDAVKVFSSN